MRVTVEGVENNQQAELVRSAACDEVQGYYFGRPLADPDLGAEALEEAKRALAKIDKSGQQRLRIVS